MKIQLILTSFLLTSATGCAGMSKLHMIDVAPSATDLANAISAAKPGDIIRVPPATYRFTKPLELTASGTPSAPIRLEAAGAERPVLDFADEQEDRAIPGIELKADHWQLIGIEVAHAGSYGIRITGSHNVLDRCITRQNRNSGVEIDPPAGHNLIINCESFQNFDPKTNGENADGFAAKHAIGPGNIFRACRAYQNADDGWDFWMAPNPILIEDCVAFRNGYNIWKIASYQGDGNGFKFGGNYIATAHICRRCTSIENPLSGFDQNHNIGGITIEDCIAIRCGKGFSFPEVPSTGQNILRRNSSFGCQNVLERHMIAEANHWYPTIPAGNLGPPPRPGHRDTPGAGAVPTTQEEPLIVPADAPTSGIPSDATGKAPAR